jgi:hypothetical protein
LLIGAIDRVAPVDGIAIWSDVSGEATLLHDGLGSDVALQAERLQRAEPEEVGVTLVGVTWSAI